MSDSTELCYNFSAGPATIPLAVLKKAQEELLCLPGAGASVMEISHRGKVFVDIIRCCQSAMVGECPKCTVYVFTCS